jgi:hypothetical protein
MAFTVGLFARLYLQVFGDRAGRASVKDATGIDLKRNCVETLLVGDDHAPP